MKHIFTISLCFLALSLSVYGQVPDYIPSDGLVAWYPFNGNALDESFNGHDANVVGATLSEDRFGSFESAYLFDGDDRIFPSNYEDFPLQERTTSIWVKSNVLATGGRGVFGYGGANCGDSWMLTYNNQGNLPSSAFAYEFQGHCNNQAVSSPMAPEDFISWHHIVGRTSQSGTDIFIDGILETHSDLFVSNTVPNCAVLGAQPSPSGLCEYQDSNNQLWDGLLDDFGVWNRALTDIEILGIFQAAPPVLGCTNQEACNFDVEAVIDDGTCHYEDGCGVCGGVSFAGCTDSYACNYDFEAGCDDGSCDYSCCPGPGCCGVGMNWNSEIGECEITNPTDSNLDGCTDLNDLMDILSAYGDCAEVNYSLSFDGVDDYVNMGSFNNYNLNNSSTSITAILKINVSQFGYQDAGEAYIFGTPMFGGNNDRGFRIETKPNNTFGIAAGGNSNIVYTYSGNKQINTWYDIAMVLDQSQDVIYLYVDGVLESQVSISQIGTINNAYNLNIGAFENISWISNLFSGLVDDVSIWNSALTQEQIQSYMSTPPTGNEEGLVGYWDFNEGTGNTLTDQTSNGNDGVINGATWSTDVPTAP
jgi:hypothetical protein